MTEDVVFVARQNGSNKYISKWGDNDDEPIYTEYLSIALMYGSYADWYSDMSKNDETDFDDHTIYPVQLNLMWRQ